MTMKVLELEPLKKKKLELVLVETEFPVQWTVEKPAAAQDEWNLRLSSDAYVSAVDGLVEKHKPAFAAEELGMRTLDEFNYDNHLVDVFSKRGIPYVPVDIEESALGYLTSTLDPLITLNKTLLEEAGRIKAAEDTSEIPRMRDILVHSEYLSADIAAEVETIRTKIREAWMMMGILDQASKIDSASINGMFLCDASHFDGIVGLADQLGVGTTKISMKKSVVKSIPESYSMDDFMQASVLEVMPIKIKQKSEASRILYMFDTDAFASPFDMNMAYDAGFNSVIPFAGVTADKVTRLVQDAMFSRKPDAPTCFFVGGSNVPEANKIAEAVQKSLFEPFLHPVVIDPRGSHTTASAMVAKTVEMAQKHGWEGISGKKVAIFGAGPVGQIAAMIGAKENANVTLVETWDQASEESIAALVDSLNTMIGENGTPITPAYAIDDDTKLPVLQGTDIIWCTATAGVQIASKDVMEQISSDEPKLVVDINAVPPSGIEGMKAKYEDKDIYPNVFGTGALALGGLKYNMESTMLKEAANTKGMKLFNYDVAYETAKTILFGKKVAVAATVAE
jgi:methylene-tetrahydromethanopterin dehydrogenase